MAENGVAGFFFAVCTTGTRTLYWHSGTTFWKRVRDFLLVCENRDPNGPEQGWGARKKAGGEKHERRPPQGRRCGAL